MMQYLIAALLLAASTNQPETIRPIQVQVNPGEQARLALTRLHQAGIFDAVLLGFATPDEREAAIQTCGDVVGTFDEHSGLEFGAHSVLLGASLRAEERTPHLVAGRDALDELTSQSMSIEAVRLVLLAHAQRLLGQSELAATTYRFVIDEFAALGDVDASTWAHAVLGEMRLHDDGSARILRALSKPPFTLGEVPDPRLTVVAINVATSLHTERFQREGDVHDFQRAIALQVGMIDRTDLGLSANDRARMAYDRIGRFVDAALTESRIQPDGVGAVGLFAAGLHRARNGQPDDASALYRTALRSASGDRLQDIRWELAVVLNSDPDMDARIEAVQLLTEIASEPGAARRLEALEAALAHGRQLAGFNRNANTAYLDVLALVTADSGVADLDLWRLEHAGMLLRDDPDQRTLHRGLDILETIAADSPRAARAEAAYAGAVRVWLDQALFEVHERRRTDGAEARELARSVVPVAQRAVLWASRRKRTEKLAFEVDLVDLFTESGSTGGLELGRALIGDATRPGDMPDPQTAIEGWPERLWLAVGRAELLVGETDTGFSMVRAVADDLDARGFYPESFWHAWTILLEALHARDGGARRSQVRAQVKRLQVLDDTLGGEPWATRLQALK